MSDHVVDPTATATEPTGDMFRTGFGIWTTDVDGSVMVHLTGELDMASAPGLGRALDAVLDAGATALCLDVARLTFIDSTGIRVFVNACRRAQRQGCPFSVRSPGRAVSKVLHLTGVDRFLGTEPDLQFG